MSRKTHPHKRTHVKRNLKPNQTHALSRGLDWRTNALGGVIALALLTYSAFAHWPAKGVQDLDVGTKAGAVENAINAPPDFSGISPDAIRSQPVVTRGYNAHSGGMPPGALPPGIELSGMPMLQGARTSDQGYGGYDGIRQQFTGKERDNETGLDYSINRYYSSTQGRFTSPDPENAGAYAGNPQTWNGYSYGLNNPMLYSDPDGLKVRVCDTSGNCTDNKTDLTDEQWNKWFGGDKSVKLKGGNIYKNGELIGTYEQQSCDSCLYDIHALGRQITASDPGGKALKLWGGSVMAGASIPSAGAGWVILGVVSIFAPGEEGPDAVALGTQADRQAAVREAWRQEAERARTGKPTNTPFTADELRQLRDTGKVSGYEGHHTESVSGNPQSARDASKIKFLKGRAAHLREHGGNWRNRTPLFRRR